MRRQKWKKASHRSLVKECVCRCVSHENCGTLEAEHITNTLHLRVNLKKTHINASIAARVGAPVVYYYGTLEETDRPNRSSCLTTILEVMMYTLTSPTGTLDGFLEQPLRPLQYAAPPRDPVLQQHKRQRR